MALGGRPVQAQTQDFDAMLLDPHQDIVGECGRGRRSDRDPDSEPARLIDQFVEIGAGERVAAGQDQLGKRGAELRELAQERNPFREAQFLRVGGGDGLGTAMPAGQRTCLRHFPIHVQRRLRIVAQFAM